MKDAMARIDKLQQDMVERPEEIDGAEEYIEKKLELYDRDEELRDNSKAIQLEEEQISNKFFILSSSLSEIRCASYKDILTLNTA